MTSEFAKRMPLRRAVFQWILRPNTFKNRVSALRRRILFANLEVMHRATSIIDLTLLYNVSILGTYSKFVRKIKCQRSAFACRSHTRALAAGLPLHDHVWITTEQLIRFHKNDLDKMLCKLDFSKYASSFRNKPDPTLSVIANLNVVWLSSQLLVREYSSGTVASTTGGGVFDIFGLQ